MIDLTPLCEIAFKYGTDKCPQLKKHGYTQVYYQLFKDRRHSVKKVLEMGIGHYWRMQSMDTIYDRRLNRHYHRGASLYMWRDFFPNAQIYGADRLQETMFKDDRITTFLCDETKKEDILELIKKTGLDIDLFVDDASHRFNHQLFLFQTVMPLLKKDVIYVIEDVRHSRAMLRAISGYDCQKIDTPIPDRDKLIVIRNK